MLVLADRNFLCHTLARDVLATGAHILWRASASFRLTPIAVLADGSYLAQLHPRRKADGPPITVRVIEYTVHTSTAADGDEDTSEVFAWSPTCSTSRPTRRWTGVRLPDALGLRDRDRAPQDRHGRGQSGAAQQDPEGVAQEMWALFAVYQAIHTLIGAAVDATGIPPEKISFPHALAAATDSVTAGFPPS